MRTLKQPSFLNSISSYLKGIEKKPDKEMKPYLLPNWVNILFELYKRGKRTEEELKRATGMDNVYRNYKNDKSYKKDENETKDFSIDSTLERVLENEFEEFKEETLKKSKEEIFESAYEITSKEEIKDKRFNCAIL